MSPVVPDMEPTGLLTAEHQSYATEHAVFMFAIADRGGAIRRFVLVEAFNRLAVHTVERVLGVDQAASETCRCMAVFRGLASLGTRDDMLEEIPYVDFMLDMVAQDRLMDDLAAVEGFNRSLSDEEREYARRKIEAEEDRPPPSVSAIHPALSGESDEDQIVQSLQEFGFRPQLVQQFVATIRHKIGRTDAKALIREGCKALAA